MITFSATTPVNYASPTTSLSSQAGLQTPLLSTQPQGDVFTPSQRETQTVQFGGSTRKALATAALLLTTGTAVASCEPVSIDAPVVVSSDYHVENLNVDGKSYKVYFHGQYPDDYPEEECKKAIRSLPNPPNGTKGIHCQIKAGEIKAKWIGKKDRLHGIP